MIIILFILDDKNNKTEIWNYYLIKMWLENVTIKTRNMQKNWEIERRVVKAVGEKTSAINVSSPPTHLQNSTSPHLFFKLLPNYPQVSNFQFCDSFDLPKVRPFLFQNRWSKSVLCYFYLCTVFFLKRFELNVDSLISVSGFVLGI